MRDCCYLMRLLLTQNLLKLTCHLTMIVRLLRNRLTVLRILTRAAIRKNVTLLGRAT